MNLIEISNLNKSFGKKKVLTNFNLNIKENEKIAILGANGCGKTTLIEMIVQFTKPDSGNIKLNIEGNVKNEIGIQLQTGEWPTGITASDMLNFYRAIYPKFTKEWESTIQNVFDVKEFTNVPLKSLSGGQKQRFNAMISMMNKPKLVILDELTTGLDMELQYKIIDFIQKSVEEHKQTLIMVSHHPDEVEKLCDRIVIIKNQNVFLDIKTKDSIKKYGSVRIMMEMFFKGELDHEK